jgi:peptidyl-Lys metalloendopeptidase
MRSKVLGRLLVSAVLLALPLAASAAGPAGLSARVEGTKSAIGRGERVVVTVTLANESAADVYLLRWQTPFAGVKGNLFDVRRDGEPVQYVGALVKFNHPRPGDYLLLRAGESRSVRVDLGRYYDISRTGEYSVQYRVALQDALRDATPTAVAELAELESSPTFLAVERDDQAPRLIETARATGAASTTQFVGCTTSRQSALNTARSNATSISGDAKGYLASHTSTTAGTRYTTWFGARDSNRYSTVTSHFNSINSAMANANVVFDCTCTDSYYAYVYSNQPYRIHLCNAFWSAPSLGTDSKAGTLVHEMSHFNVVAATDDWAYGQSACKNLATKKPSRAVDNADSHEYFSENTPALN